MRKAAKRDRKGRRFIRTGGKFPLRGKTRRARRNRSLSLATAVGTAGLGLIALTGAGRYTGPLKSVLGTTGYQEGRYEQRPGYRGFSTHRGAGRAETMFARAVSSFPRGRGALMKLGIRTVEHGPLSRTGRNWEVSGVPLGMRRKHALREKVANAVDAGSIWNVAGRGKLLGAIESGTVYGEEYARAKAKVPIRAIGAAANKLIEQKAARAETFFGRRNRRLATRVRILGHNISRRTRGKSWRSRKKMRPNG